MRPGSRNPLVTIALALIASLLIGVSDFLGGVASRTASALRVTAVLQLVAFLALAPAAALMGASDLALGDCALGAASGVATGAAYLAFFAAIGHGRISVVVPVSAAMTALIPAAVGVLHGSSLSLLATGGVACAFVAIPLVAYDEAPAAPGDWSAVRQVVVALLTGIGFGSFFVAIGHTGPEAGLWPTVANLAVGAAVTGVVAATRKVGPSPRSAPPGAVAGGLALATADVALTTALQHGPLTVASVLGNLYPVVTIALGVAVLHERVRSWHAVGIALAVGGIALIAAG